jgi:hypothetical protein
MTKNGDSRRSSEEAVYFVVQSGHLFKEILDEHRNITQYNCLSSQDMNGLSLNHETRTISTTLL